MLLNGIELLLKLMLKTSNVSHKSVYFINDIKQVNVLFHVYITQCIQIRHMDVCHVM